MSAARGAVALTVVTLACTSGPRENATVRLTIPRGASLSSIAESLATTGVVESARLFRFYARITGRSRALQAGTFELPQATSVRRLLAILDSGRAVLERLVIPEGLMLTEVAEAVQRQLGVPADSVLHAAHADDVRARLRVPGPTLEGYLYPSTYHVRVNATAREIVDQMVAGFMEQWKPAWRARLDSLGFTRHEIVTLASIIEGEVRHERDRAFVASVYHNRLRRGMRLQADPTVIYALGRRRRLFERDYQTRSPYNTYLIDGLPPGPIGQPSAASIEAALYPARSDFLFLVARPDGQHVFSRTLREHLQAVRQVRQMRDGG